MGGAQSEKRDQIIDIIEQYPIEKKGSFTQKQFSQALFHSLDQKPTHTAAGPILVTGSYVLKRFYSYLRSQSRGQLTKSKLVNTIEQCFNDPQVAIEYSYRIIQPVRELIIQKTDFINFISNCYTRGIGSILKELKNDHKFKSKFAEWMNSNNAKILEATQRLFDQHALTRRDQWTLGDFKRWILSNNQWTLHIEIKGNTYRIPLNIPCLFGIILEPQKKK